MSEEDNFLSILSFDESFRAKNSYDEEYSSSDDDSYCSDQSSYSKDTDDTDDNLIGGLNWNNDYKNIGEPNNTSFFSQNDVLALSDDLIDTDLDAILGTKPIPDASQKSPSNKHESMGMELSETTDISKIADLHRNEDNKDIDEESDYSTHSVSSLSRKLQVYYAQHSVSGHQKPINSDDMEPASDHVEESSNTRYKKIYHHRVTEMYHDEYSKDSYDDKYLVSEVIEKLSSYPIQDELSAMKSELKKREIEISALEDHNKFYEKQLNQLESISSQYSNEGFSPENASIIDRQWGNLSNTKPERSFAEKAKSVLSGNRQKNSHVMKSMRKHRGLYFDFQILGDHDDIKTTITNFQSQSKKTSTAKTICNVSLTGRSSYFMNWDNGKWCHHGPIPINFLNRLERQSSEGKCPNVRYLSIGPAPSYYTSNCTCYYAELSDSEFWWVNFDADFHDAVQNLPVHRVAFGSSYPGSEGKPSWIVLGKDGRSVWKGIPTHLHSILTSRDSSLCAACEVSLGSSGSFFIKFLSDEIDYCLPATIANKCEEIEKKGGVITNVQLHVDCNGYIIRHTEIKKKEKN